jgi:hypothetical protein
MSWIGHMRRIRLKFGLLSAKGALYNRVCSENIAICRLSPKGRACYSPGRSKAEAWDRLNKVVEF